MTLVPESFAALGGRDASWSTWLDGLPALARELLDDWDLVRDGEPRHGECALVLPVRTAEERAGVLKLTWPHPEARHEHLALRDWHGDGAVELWRADPHRWALLLERAHTRDLGSVDDVAACEVVGALYRRLHRPATPRLDRLSDLAADWAARLRALPRDSPVPHRLVEHAVALATSFAEDPDTDGTLIHSDLHYANVLAADREPWLVIDPKPLSGDPHYEPTPLLWNRWEEAVASGDVRFAVRRRFDAAVEAGGLTPERSRDWVVVRGAVNALWCIEAVTARGAAFDSGDHEWIGRSVAVAKAVLD